MRRWMVAALGVGLLVAPAGAEDATSLATDKDKVSYAIGVDIGRNLVRQSVEVTPELLTKGLNDVLSGKQTLMSDDEVRKTLTEFQKVMREKQAEIQKKAGEENKKKGEEFLTENAKKEGVVTLPSGLQYKILTKGEGKIPTATDAVECNYRGTLIDGTEFDSSYKRGQPATFPVKGVIPGWTEALQLMPVGSKWQLFVPPKLGYGERGAGRDIGPNATLIFEIELLGIKEASEAKGGSPHTGPKGMGGMGGMGASEKPAGHPKAEEKPAPAPAK